ncbi:hypothetical protein ACFLZW_04875 [Chloroflexota bacterium]
MFSPTDDPTSSTSSQQTCPHCGQGAPASAFICPHCSKNLLQDVSAEAFDEYAEFEKPPLMRTLLTAAALALLLFLAGFTLLDIDTLFGRADLALYARYSLLAIAILFLAVFAARGRRPKPTALNYLVNFVIVIIPVIGTLYGLFYAGRALANRKLPRALIYVLLMVVAVAAFLRYGGTEIVVNTMERFNIGQPAATEIAMTTEEPQPTATKAPTKTPTAEDDSEDITEETEEPTEAPDGTEEPAAAPDVADCVLWSDVTLDDVGSQMCVYGEFIRTYKKEELTWVMVFSEEPGVFQLWSTPKDIAAYLPEDGSTCIMATGWIKTTGIRPMIILRIYDELQVCP